jgi:hypothetical protein
MPQLKKSRVNHGTSRKRRRLAIGMVGALALLFAFVTANTLRPLTSEALAQQHVHTGHVAGQTFEPLLDGSTQPDAIPDHVAIRALMQTLRIPRNPDAESVKQLRTRVGRADFSDADMTIVVRALTAFDTPAKDQQALIEAVRPSSAEATTAAIDRYVEEQKRFDLLILAHYEQLLASLSPEGAAKLQEHLQHVKSRIKVYPTPNMSATVD